jgi:hypothetical protein
MGRIKSPSLEIDKVMSLLAVRYTAIGYTTNGKVMTHKKYWVCWVLGYNLDGKILLLQ